MSFSPFQFSSVDLQRSTADPRPVKSLLTFSHAKNIPILSNDVIMVNFHFILHLKHKNVFKFGIK